MDSVPRIDEWMPLASQQLRLRHLIRIIGLHIICRERCKLYFTLHLKINCPPFYRSGEILHYGSSETILWDNISCPDLFKSNSTSICVRVWERSRANSQLSDKSIFAWHVSFSGLVLTGSRIDANHFSNTLIFQLNGNCFSSPEHFSSFTLARKDMYCNHDRDPNKVKIQNSEMEELSERSENGETIQRDSEAKLKYTDSSLDLCEFRCIAARRLKSSARQSYSLNKLLRIQQIQRSCKHLVQDLHDITEGIIHHNLKRKVYLSKNRSKIDCFLSDIEEIKPEAKLECKELNIKIQKLRFDCNFLEKEYKLALQKNKELIKLLRSKKDLTKSQCDALRDSNSRLAENKSLAYKETKIIITDVNIKKDLELKIRKRLGFLGFELKYIYPVTKISVKCFTICNLPFPNKNYINTNSMNTDCYKLITPGSFSVALGFVAHFIEITSIILDKPLRFLQHTKPSIPSKQILYVTRLLDYNIAQLNYDTFHFAYDPNKDIIENFLRFFCSIIQLAEVDDDDVIIGKVDIKSELGIFNFMSQTEDVWKVRSLLQHDRNVQVEWSLPSQRRKNASSICNKDKPYHSEDNLKTLSDHCLKYSYSQERLVKE